MSSPTSRILHELLTLEDGTRCVVEEERQYVERRARMLRTCALLIRVQCESYERKMPAPERRTYRDLDAYCRFQQEVSGSVCRIVSRVSEIAPGGAAREWEKAVAEVGRLSYEEASAELMTFPRHNPLHERTPERS